MIASLKRILHAYGHGVHSPLAFALCMDILRQRKGYAYYGYDSIRKSLHDTHSADFARIPKLSRRQYAARARFLLRLVAYLRPESIWINANIHPCFMTALRKGAPNATVSHNPDMAAKCALVIDLTGEMSDASLKSLSQTPGLFLLAYNRDRQSIRHIAEAMPYGLAMVDHHTLLSAGRTDMCKTQYTIPIP